MPEHQQKSELVTVRLDPKTLFLDFAKGKGVVCEDAEGIGESLQYFAGKSTARASLESAIRTMAKSSSDKDLSEIDAGEAVDAIASPHYPPE